MIDVMSTPQPRPSEPRRRPTRSLLDVSLFLLLAFHFADFGAIPYDTDHDTASHAAFAYFTQEQLQFGVDVFENAGPLAFSNYSATYSGILTGPGITIKIAVRTALALLVVLCLRWMPNRTTRLIWLATIALPALLAGTDDLPALDTTDAHSILTLYIAAIALLRPTQRASGGVARDAGLLVLIVTLALMKHTLLLLSTATLGITFASRLARNDAPGATRLALFTVVASAVEWFAAGQQLRNVPAFLWGIAAFSSGYNDALAIDPSPALQTLAAFVLISSLALCLRNTLSGACSGWHMLASIPFAFVLWKYGMVRGDDAHVLVLFLTASQWIPALLWAGHPPISYAHRSIRLSIRTGSATTMIAVAGLWMTIPLRLQPELLTMIWEGKLDRLRAPSRYFEDLAEELSRNRERSALPRVRARVGSNTIDQFGFRQGPLLLNGLRYRPRPAPISFAASSPELLARNEAFYRGLDAPDFVLTRLEPLSPFDSHLLAQRDGLALGALLDGYRPLLTENGYLLMQRIPRTGRQLRTDRREISHHEARWGERIPIGTNGSRFVWASLDLRPVWTTRLRSFLMRGPSLRVRLWLADGEVVVRRLSTSTSSTPFLISPFLESNDDILDVYSGGEPRRVVALALEPGTEHLFAPTPLVRFYEGSSPKSQSNP